MINDVIDNFVPMYYTCIILPNVLVNYLVSHLEQIVQSYPFLLEIHPIIYRTIYHDRANTKFRSYEIIKNRILE